MQRRRAAWRPLETEACAPSPGGSEVKMPPPRTLTWADRSGEVQVSENKAGFDAQPVK